jgi:MarR family transcriptional regulator for hemolysin
MNAPVIDHSQDLDFRFVNALRESYWLLRDVIDKRLEPLGLSQARWRPLLCLYLGEAPMTQVQLARMLSLEAPTVVRLLDRLSACGWIVRRSCPDDRRAYHVELTPRARSLCVEIDQIVTQIRRQGLAGVPEHELAIATSVLERARDGYASLLDSGVKTEPSRRRRKVARSATAAGEGDSRPAIE